MIFTIKTRLFTIKTSKNVGLAGHHYLASSGVCMAPVAGLAAAGAAPATPPGNCDEVGPTP